ncbi:MAG: hypothetical protein JXR07_01505 [Reichenbachiella sp.]
MARFLSFQNKVDSEIDSFLSENVLGTPGQSMVYKQLKTSEKLNHIPNPTFMSLKKGNNLIGTSCFCSRPLSDYNSFYIRYFSFNAVYRRNTPHSSGQKKNSLIKEEVLDALESESPFNLNENPSIFYAYVDPNNERSRKLCAELGFKNVRSFSTITFSRFSPEKDKRIEKLKDDQKGEMRKLLNNQYSEYSFYTEENLFYKDGYFVIRNRSNEILAGVQASLEKWDIREMPGFVGWITLNVLSKVPFLKRIINPNYRFITLESIYLKNGNEQLLEGLLESVLSLFHVNVGLITADKQSNLYHNIKKLRLGPLNKLKKEVGADIIVKSSQSSMSLSNFHDKPCFISTLDLA